MLHLTNQATGIERQMGPLARRWYRLSSSFWFLPGSIIAGATLLAFITIEADARFVTAGALEA